MIRIVVALLIACHQVTTYDFSYSELENLGGSCYPRDSCEPPRKDHEDHLWGNHTCECGMHCIRYGTCCIDSQHAGRRLNFQYRGETCQKPSGFEFAVVLVTRCPDKMRYGSDELRLKCESQYEEEDPVMMAPVTSLETHATYKNYFCALCNGDTRDIFLWNIRLEFAPKESLPSEVTEEDFLGNLVYSDERKAWGVMKVNEFHEVKVKFVVPQPLRKLVKKCYPGMVNECDMHHDCDYEFRYKCSSYYAPIKVREIGGYARKYRNIHCAMCNNVNVSLTDANVCKLEVHKRKTKPAFSFALLLDVNRRDGDLVGKKQKCNDNEKWDPFFKKCRHLACGLPGHVLKDGKCVQD